MSVPFINFKGIQTYLNGTGYKFEYCIEKVHKIHDYCLIIANSVK